MTRISFYSISVAILIFCLSVGSPLGAQAQEESNGENGDLPTVIDPEIFNSQLRLDLIEIEAAPFQRIGDVLTSHVGVNKEYSGADAIRFRGTGIEGTDFIVDGISQSNPYSNTPNYSINLEAIESVDIQTSGFTAEYGNVRSGVINITTRGDSGTPSLMNIKDEELAHIAAAFVAIVELREAHDRNMISTEKFESQTIDAIRSQSVSLERYAEVLQAAQNNSKLQERLLDLARRVADQVE